MNKRYRTGDQIWVRERNLAILLQYLWDAGRPLSRTDLTRTSGLNKSTVGSLLSELQTWGLVTESGIENERPGRPGMLFDLNPDAGRIIGLEIGVGFITVVLADVKARVIWRKQIDRDEEGHPLASVDRVEILELAQNLAQEAIEVSRSSNCRLFGIGLGVPGLVNRNGVLTFAPNLGWRNIPLRDLWRRRFDVPIMVANDANVSALGEQMLGAARQADNLLFLSSGMGLGGGLVINGQLFEGTGGYAGEIGHMTIEPEGPLCNCGNHGCWETLVGPRAVLQRVRQAAREGTAPNLVTLAQGDPEAIEIEHVVAAASRGDPIVLTALAEVGRYLGIGIANLVNALNPRMVVLGGYMSLIGPYILPHAQAEVVKRALADNCEGAEIKVSAFQLDACVMGAVALILRQVLSNPVVWYRRSNENPLEHPLALSAGVL